MKKEAESRAIAESANVMLTASSWVDMQQQFVLHRRDEQVFKSLLTASSWADMQQQFKLDFDEQASTSPASVVAHHDTSTSAISATVTNGGSREGRDVLHMISESEIRSDAIEYIREEPTQLQSSAGRDTNGAVIDGSEICSAAQGDSVEEVGGARGFGWGEGHVGHGAITLAAEKEIKQGEDTVLNIDEPKSEQNLVVNSKERQRKKKEQCHSAVSSVVCLLILIATGESMCVCAYADGIVYECLCA